MQQQRRMDEKEVANNKGERVRGESRGQNETERVDQGRVSETKVNEEEDDTAER